MSEISFKRDVKGLFSKYVDDMKKVSLPLPDSSGTAKLYLGDYDSVKTFHYQIQVALHGYDYDSRSGTWRVPERQRLPAAEPGEFVQFAPHPMPPDGRLPQEAIDLFDRWVKDGMLA